MVRRILQYIINMDMCRYYRDYRVHRSSRTDLNIYKAALTNTSLVHLHRKYTL